MLRGTSPQAPPESIAAGASSRGSGPSPAPSDISSSSSELMVCPREKKFHAPAPSRAGGLLPIKHFSLLLFIPSSPLPQLGSQRWDLTPPGPRWQRGAALLPFPGDEGWASEVAWLRMPRSSPREGKKEKDEHRDGEQPAGCRGGTGLLRCRIHQGCADSRPSSAAQPSDGGFRLLGLKRHQRRRCPAGTGGGRFVVCVCYFRRGSS